VGYRARVSIVDVRDIAEVAAVVLTQIGHEGKTCDTTGPEAQVDRKKEFRHD
jgi:uncharacterized protein YbjT (DUF2867 family)